MSKHALNTIDPKDLETACGGEAQSGIIRPRPEDPTLPGLPGLPGGPQKPGPIWPRPPQRPCHVCGLG